MSLVHCHFVGASNAWMQLAENEWCELIAKLSLLCGCRSSSRDLKLTQREANCSGKRKKNPTMFSSHLAHSLPALLLWETILTRKTLSIFQGFSSLTHTHSSCFAPKEGKLFLSCFSLWTRKKVFCWLFFSASQLFERDPPFSLEWESTHRKNIVHIGSASGNIARNDSSWFLSSFFSSWKIKFAFSVGQKWSWSWQTLYDIFFHVHDSTTKQKP